LSYLILLRHLLAVKWAPALLVLSFGHQRTSRCILLTALDIKSHLFLQRITVILDYYYG